MTMEEKIIHFDGADKTGKDTIRDLIVKHSQGKYLIYVRSYISQLVYSRLYERYIDEYFFWKRMKEDYDKGDRFFYFTCDLEKVRQRFIDHNEQDLSIDDYEKHQKIFQDVVLEAKHHGIHIDWISTSTLSVEETAEQIKKLINKR